MLSIIMTLIMLSIIMTLTIIVDHKNVQDNKHKSFEFF